MKVIKVQMRVTKRLDKKYHELMYVQPYQLGTKRDAVVLPAE